MARPVVHLLLSCCLTIGPRGGIDFGVSIELGSLRDDARDGQATLSSPSASRRRTRSILPLVKACSFIAGFLGLSNSLPALLTSYRPQSGTERMRNHGAFSRLHSRRRHSEYRPKSNYRFSVCRRYIPRSIRSVEVLCISL